MVPRADIIAVDDTLTIDELMRVFRQAEHSRLPVYHETLDDPRGMIHIRDLMSWITDGGGGRRGHADRSRQGRPGAERRLDRHRARDPLRAGIDVGARPPAQDAV